MSSLGKGTDMIDCWSMEEIKPGLYQYIFKSFPIPKDVNPVCLGVVGGKRQPKLPSKRP